jgi:hypothetical protein
MAKLFGELLFAMVRAFVQGLAYSLFLKVGAWLDTEVHGRTARIVVGILLGIAAFFLIPIVTGLLSF